MGVDAGRGGKAGVSLGEGYRALALRQGGADDYDVADAGLPGAREDGLAVGVERRIAQMAVGVDQPRHTAALERTPEPPPPPGAAGGGLSGTEPGGRSASPASSTSAMVVAMVVPCVSTERGSVSLIERFRISYRFWRRNLCRFSRTRSKMMIVSLSE